LTALSPEQVPVAEQLFRGGLPAVRTALNEQNAKAKADGSPEVPEATVMKIAEDLVGQVRIADWLDRAEAAAADADEIALRDLRAVVGSADDVARDESTRELAASLRSTLERRTVAEQEEWLNEVRGSLSAGRVVRALRLSARPPQPNESLPDEVSTALATAAGAALAADAPADRWATVLDAVAYSPVRRSITPAGAPAEPGDELMAAVTKHVGRVPSIGPLFGITPPAPGPRPRPAPRRASEVQAAAGLVPPPGRVPPPPMPSVPPPPAPATARPEATREATPEERGETTDVPVATAAEAEAGSVAPGGERTDAVASAATAPEPTTADTSIGERDSAPADTTDADADAATPDAVTTEPEPGETDGEVVVEPGSDDGVDDSVVVEELGQAVDEA
jgi:hypothetical protein